MGIFGRFGKPKAGGSSPTEAGEPQNRRRSGSGAYNPTYTPGQSAPEPRPSPPPQEHSALSIALSEDGASEQPTEHLQQAQDPYANFSEPGTPPHSHKGSAAILNSQGSLYRQSHSNGMDHRLHSSSAPSPGLAAGAGVLTTPKQDGTPYDVPYGHTRVFIGASFDQVLERVGLCLQMQGFHIMSSVDLQEALQGAKVQCGDFRRYTMLTACHPKLFFKGVFEEPSLGLLPPSTVLVMEGDFNKTDIVVQVTKPSTIYRALHNPSPKLRGILSETDARFKLMLDSIASMAEDTYA